MGIVRGFVRWQRTVRAFRYSPGMPDLIDRTMAVLRINGERWQGLAVPEGSRFAWEADSTYIRKPPFLEGVTMTPPGAKDLYEARAGGARRQHHHRSHFARGRDQAQLPGWAIPR